MFEGKHIHFSPVDNKPLCSFSNKLCRQRRLNGYAFCIRHILEDKSAPFKRCTFVTRNNNQICQNAIPTNQERGYCHSHMQVAGIIPKTERKQKNVKATDSTANGTLSKIDSNSSSSNSSNGTNVKKDPNAVFKFEEEHSEIQWIPKGGSINGIVNSGKSNVNSKDRGDVIIASLKEVNSHIGGGAIDEHVNSLNSTKKIEVKNSRNQQLQNALNGSTVLPAPETLNTKFRQTYGKKPSNNTVAKPRKPIPSALEKPNNCDNTTGKNLYDGNEKTTSPAAVIVPICSQEYNKYFEQFKTLKSVEKSVNKSDLLNSKTKILYSSKISLDDSISSSTPKINGTGSQNTMSKICVTDFLNNININNAQKVSATNPWFPSTEMSAKTSESRQEFLSRVRQTFKSQYTNLKNATKDSDKSEKIWKRALRTSLLTCVVKDSSYSAHVLIQNDPLKYSPPIVDKLDSIIKDVATLKSKRALVNGVKSNLSGNKIVNGLNTKQQTAVDEAKISIKTEHSSRLDDNSEIVGVDVILSSNPGENKMKSKASKPTSDRGNLNLPIENGGQQLKKPRSKRNPRKIPPALAIIDEYFQNGIDSKAQKSKSISINSKTTAAITKSNDLIDNDGGIIGNDLMNKKRKFDAFNGTDSSAMDSTATFRVPKLDSSSLNDIVDIKIENGHHRQLGFGNYNAHIIKNNELLNSSAMVKTSVANSQVHLQQILSQPDLRTLASSRNQGLDTVLNSVGSSDITASDGVITDASFDSTFDHSVSSQQDCEFSDDDLEKSLEFQIDPETEHQASRLLEDNELTEDDLNELFPDSRIGDNNKLGRSDMSDLGVDFTSSFDANDIDYSLFANIFPFSRANQSESISVTNQF